MLCVYVSLRRSLQGQFAAESSREGPSWCGTSPLQRRCLSSRRHRPRALGSVTVSCERAFTDSGMNRAVISCSWVLRGAEA